MRPAPNGTDLLQRSIRASWLLALALATLALPKDPAAAISILAGEGIMAANFFFLARLVKLFTERVAGEARGTASARATRDLSILLWGGAKLAVVYGGAFALTRWRPLEFLPLLLGLSMPLLAIVLKAIMLALGAGPSPVLRRATTTAGPAGHSAKPAAFFLLAGLLLLAARPVLAGEAAGGGEGGQHLPNWLVILNDYLPQNPVVHWMFRNEYLVFAWIGGCAFFLIAWLAMRNARPDRLPGPLQNGFEWVVESMEDVTGGMLGRHNERYFPFIMAIFFYILTMNLIGIVPGFKSATSTLDVTLALALITFLYVQWSGIRNLGPLGYIDHLAGSPRDVIGFAMLPVMIPVHVLGELVKPVSLSCRLFGNIFGEDTLIVVFVSASALCLKASLLVLGAPPLMGITALFMLLQTLTSIVQALIFSLLTTVYLYMMLPHGEHTHEEAHGHS